MLACPKIVADSGVDVSGRNAASPHLPHPKLFVIESCQLHESLIDVAIRLPQLTLTSILLSSSAGKASSPLCKDRRALLVASIAKFELHPLFQCCSQHQHGRRQRRLHGLCRPRKPYGARNLTQLLSTFPPRHRVSIRSEPFFHRHDLVYRIVAASVTDHSRHLSRWPELRELKVMPLARSRCRPISIGVLRLSVPWGILKSISHKTACHLA